MLFTRTMQNKLGLNRRIPKETRQPPNDHPTNTTHFAKQTIY